MFSNSFFGFKIFYSFPYPEPEELVRWVEQTLRRPCMNAVADSRTLLPNVRLGFGQSRSSRVFFF